MPYRSLLVVPFLAVLGACSSEAIDTGNPTGGTGASGGSGGSGGTSGSGGTGGGGIPDYTSSPCYGEPATTEVYNLATHETTTVNATCRAEGNRARVYVADELWLTQPNGAASPLNQAEINAFMQGYELEGASKSYRPDLGVLATDEAVFGELTPELLTDGKLPIFVIDSNGAGEGYLCGWCTATELHLDYPLLGSLHTEKTLSIAAHESFHAIHRGFDPTEAPWVDETLAEAAMTVNGFYTDQTWVKSFLHDTNVAWGPTLTDAHDFNYGAGLLLGTFLWERGGEALLRAVTQDKKHDWAGIDSALASVGDAASSSEIWLEMALALFLDDPASGHEFRSFELAGQTLPYAVATGDTLSDTLATYGLVFVTFDEYATSVTLSATAGVSARLVQGGSPAEVREVSSNETVEFDETPRVLLLTAANKTNFSVSVD